MDKMIYSLLLILFASSSYAQNDYIKDINFYADIVNNAFDLDHKARANEYLNDAVASYIYSDEFSKEDIKELKFLSITQPEDEAFILISWQLEQPEMYEYFGYLFHNDKWHELHSIPYNKDIEYESGDTKHWLGAIYYDHITKTVKDKKYYILFGYNGYSKFENIKLAEVLHFEDGKAIFGSDVFEKSDGDSRKDIKSRVVLRYAENAKVTINNRPGINMILQDHLILRMGENPNMGLTYLPDGSYIGWSWNTDTGVFEYVDKVYDLISETPPIAPNKKVGNKDLFGRSKE